MESTTTTTTTTTASESTCPGATNVELAGRAEACAGCPNQSICSSAPKTLDPNIALISTNLDSIQNIILVLSGKGGVGKSTICALIAQHFQANHHSTCILDVDLCGPSQAHIMGCPQGSRLHLSATGLTPVYTQSGVAVVSMAFLLESPDFPVIWRGDKKNAIIKQFLRDVDFSGIDTVIIDTPPGTSDEHLALAQLLKGKNMSAVLVTTPQEVAWQDVRKEIDFCRKVNISLLGIVENMTGGVRCRQCGFLNDDLFPEAAGVKAYADDHGIPFLGRLPVDQGIAMACDQGITIRDAVTADIADTLDCLCESIFKSL